MPKCKEPNYCCDNIKGEPGCIGPQGPNGARGIPGLRGPSNENFVFGLTSTDGLAVSTPTTAPTPPQYWLIPGGQIDVSGIFLTKTIGVAPSMAVAYDKVDISRCAIHISAESLVEYNTQIEFYIYSFCDKLPSPPRPESIDVSGSTKCTCKKIDIVKAGCSDGALAVGMSIISSQNPPQAPQQSIRGSINISITLYANSPLTAPT